MPLMNGFDSNQVSDTVVEEASRGSLRDVLEWLAPLNFNQVHEDRLGRRQEGTGSWFLEDEVFQIWIIGENRQLWCPGERKP